MRAVWWILRKDLLLRLRSPLAPLVFLAFPFVFSGLIALAFGSGGSAQTPRFSLALVDQDGEFVAGLVRGALGQEQAAQFLDVEETDWPTAERQIEKNRVAGAIVIPAGFSRAVLEREPTQLRVVRNPAAAIGPLAVEETAEFLTLLLEGGATLLAAPLERIRALAGDDAAAEPWAPDAQVADIAVMVNRSMRGFGQFLFPPAITLSTVASPLEVPPASAEGAANADAGDRAAEPEGDDEEDGGSDFGLIFRYVLPGMASFALFMLAIGLTADIFQEKRQRTLARQLAAPIPASAVIFGKLLATVAIGLLVVIAMALIGALLLGARADLPAFALLSLFFLVAVTGFVSLLYSLGRDERQGGTIASIALMVMAFLGGSFIPLNNLPQLAREIAPLTLNYWAIEGYQSLLIAGGTIADIVLPLIVFLATGVVTVLASALLMRRRFAQGV